MSVQDFAGALALKIQAQLDAALARTEALERAARRLQRHVVLGAALPPSPFPPEVAQHWCAIRAHWFACWMQERCDHGLKVPCGDCTHAVLNRKRIPRNGHSRQPDARGRT